VRQLTGLDAQFLALETPRQSGHVSGLAILNPSTTPSGSLELADVQAMIAERLPLLPPFRWRLRPVPLGSTTRTGSTIPTSTSAADRA